MAPPPASGTRASRAGVLQRPHLSARLPRRVLELAHPMTAVASEAGGARRGGYLLRATTAATPRFRSQRPSRKFCDARKAGRAGRRRGRGAARSRNAVGGRTRRTSALQQGHRGARERWRLFWSMLRRMAAEAAPRRSNAAGTTAHPGREGRHRGYVHITCYAEAFAGPADAAAGVKCGWASCSGHVASAP
eukprot:365657-Chlamydomonas_euryale.AAC.5